MKKIKMSLVIPVYNVEKYLGECLDSCLSQTLQEIEIICVNDSSPDNCAQILADYASKDSRLKIITHRQNKGLGGARNSGMSVAQGEYIWFIDSDDFIASYACELLYNTAMSHNVDVLQFGHPITFEDTEHGKILKNYERLQYEYRSFFPQVQHKENFPVHVSSWSYVCKLSVSQSFLFREKVIHEDVDRDAILFASVKSILQFPCGLYFRRIHSESIIGFHVKQKHVTDFLAAGEAVANFIKTKKISSSHFVYKFGLQHLRYYKNNMLSQAPREWSNPLKKRIEVLEKFYRSKKWLLRLQRLFKYLLPYGVVDLWQRYKNH